MPYDRTLFTDGFTRVLSELFSLSLGFMAPLGASPGLFVIIIRIYEDELGFDWVVQGLRVSNFSGAYRFGDRFPL